jgi:predicted dinucleotide-binding enzyme
MTRAASTGRVVQMPAARFTNRKWPSGGLTFAGAFLGILSRTEVVVCLEGCGMEPKYIAVIGTGVVGKTLATGFLSHGYAVVMGSRDAGKLKSIQADIGNGLEVGTPAEAAAAGDLVILAVKGTAAIAALSLCGVDNIAGKVIMDTTNPIADAPPVNGVLQFFTGPNDSLLEQLQKSFAQGRFVKAFSCVGSPYMVDPKFSGGRPTMFIAGNDEAAKRVVERLLDELGWDTEDMGAAESARAIEPLCQLWCIPGLREGRWNHAFKLLHA